MFLKIKQDRYDSGKLLIMSICNHFISLLNALISFLTSTVITAHSSSLKL